MPLDPEKEKAITKLLLKGWKYQRIQQELHVSLDEIVKVNEDMRADWEKLELEARARASEHEAIREIEDLRAQVHAKVRLAYLCARAY